MQKTLIVGGGKACRMLLNNLSVVKQFNIIGIVDDNIHIGLKVKNKYPILGKLKDICHIAKANKIQTIIIAIPSERGEIVRRILLSLRQLSFITFYIIPRLPEIIVRDEIFFEDIKKIEPVDLIGRKINIQNQTRVIRATEGKTFLITGAAGSIGSELSRQLYVGSPNSLILLDNSEKNLFYLKYRLSLIRPDILTRIQFVLGDVNNTALLKYLFTNNTIHTVFHAAAYKHVPLLENNIYEAAQNNILTTFNVAQVASQHNIHSFMLISTDKAVQPSCIMGMTKYIAEKIIQHFDHQSKTIFSSVRFGNVFNSNGSVVELFTKQIEQQEALTITDPSMKRYFMSVSEATHLVLNAWTRMQKDRTYMFHMGSSVSVIDLAQCLLTINHQPANYPMRIVGKRQGEKTYELLWDRQKEERIGATYNGVYAIQKRRKFNKTTFEYSLHQLFMLLKRNEVKNHSLSGIKKLKKILKCLCEDM